MNDQRGCLCHVPGGKGGDTIRTGAGPGKPRPSAASRRSPKARWDEVESPSRFRLLIEHDLFGKPVPTFPDHALGMPVSSKDLLDTLPDKVAAHDPNHRGVDSDQSDPEIREHMMYLLDPGHTLNRVRERHDDQGA